MSMKRSHHETLLAKAGALSPRSMRSLIRIANAFGGMEAKMKTGGEDAIPLASPDITHREIEAVLSVLTTSTLSLGPKLAEFENNIAKYAGTRYAVAVNSGTSALHLVIRALGLGPGDEVITTPFSFIASSNCILFEGAKPVFADIDPVTYNIDPGNVEEKITPRTKAILAVDVFGQPADWKELKRIAKSHDLYLIEDSAEAIGSEYYGRKAGSLGDAGIYAFYPNKQITTGEGGVITTDDRRLAELCASMRNQGHDMASSWLEHPRLGYNYRLSDIHCALGIAQLRRIEGMIRKRTRVAEWYDRELRRIPGLVLPNLRTPGVRTNWFVYVVRLDDAFTKKDRERVLLGLRRQGIGCREYFPAIHLQKFYRDEHGYRTGDFPVAERVSEGTLALPYHNNLRREEVRRVARVLASLLKR